MPRITGPRNHARPPKGEYDRLRPCLSTMAPRRSHLRYLDRLFEMHTSHKVKIHVASRASVGRGLPRVTSVRSGSTLVRAASIEPPSAKP